MIRLERKANGHPDYQRQRLSPEDTLRAELRDRETFGDLNHEKSSMLLKLACLYKVTVFEVKPQIFPTLNNASCDEEATKNRSSWINT